MGFIYKITNSVNDKIYIGLTTQAIGNRWNNYKYGHKSASISHNSAILSAMVKYGFDKFKIEEVEGDIPNSELDDKEIFYISNFDTKIPKGYNIANGGRSMGGLSKKNSKPVYQIHAWTFEIISQEDSVTAMGKKLDIAPTSISNICHRKDGHFIANGFTFAFVKDFSKVNIENHLSRRMQTLEFTNGVEVYNMNSKQIIGTYLTAYKAAQELEVDSGNFYGFLRGERKTAGKYNGNPIGIRYTNNPKLNSIAMLKRLDVIDTTKAFKNVELNDIEKELQITWNYIKLWEIIEDKE